MEITARKKSTDPVQEQLREHKDKWNLAAKEFINRIIAFKRALNGRGDAKFGLPPNNIKDAFPNNVPSFLNQLALDFDALASEAGKIITEQENYAHNRRQPKQASLKYKNMLCIGETVLPTLLAVTAEEQEKGLMYQEWPPPNMAFVYTSPRVNRFWMKSTPSPLDIVFSLNGKITSIKKGEPYSTSLIGDFEVSDLVVELPYGTCQKLGFKVGHSISILKSAEDLALDYSKKYLMK